MTDPIDDIGTWAEQAEAARRRLSPTALKVVLRIGEKWEVTQEGSLALIGLSKLPSSIGVTLSADQFYRAGIVIEIFKAVNELFDQPLADRWLSQSNRNPIFGGATPLEAMWNGGIGVMVDVLQYLRAIQQGL